MSHLQYPATHFAALVWLTGSHATPLVTSQLPLNSYIGKHRISLGVASILRMWLYPHAEVTGNQEVLLGRFCLRIRVCYETFHQPLTVFEPIFKQFHLLSVASMIHQIMQPFINMCFMRVLIHKLKKQPSQPAAIPVSSQLKDLSKFLSQKRHCQKRHSQNSTLKKYILKIAPSIKTSEKCFWKKTKCLIYASQ